MNRSGLGTGVAILIALATGVAVGAFFASDGGPGAIDAAPPAQVVAPAKLPRNAVVLTPAESAQLAEVMDRVQRDYVDDVSHPALVDDALRGVVSGLDPYSSFLDAEEYADLRVSTAGTYAGIGIEVSTADRALRVVRPFRDSPAAAAGIRSGDMIAAIDDEPVGTDLDGAMARMRGPRGSIVKLAVMRAGQMLPLEFKVERAQVDVHSVYVAQLGGGILYARIVAFSDTTAADFAANLARVRSGEGKPRGLVLDLRNNPGGVLESAVDVADQLLDEGVIVSADGRTPSSRFSMRATPGDVLPGVPVVVLVNASTASAAEILAGALQDHRRAVLVGKRTFGKGSVQTVMPLSSGRAIKLTTSRYFTPSGRSIQGSGIEPDHAFEDDGVALDLDDPRIRATLASRDGGIRAALDVLQGRKPRAPGTSLAATETRPRQ
jgi:carboxyl-terminal processing protease